MSIADAFGNPGWGFGSGSIGKPRDVGAAHTGLPVLASNAQTLLPIVQTKTTSRTIPSLPVRRGKYSGCASILGSSPVTVKLHSLTIRLLPTFLGVSRVSARFAAVRALSYDRVSTAVWARAGNGIAMIAVAVRATIIATCLRIIR